jgi:hypothetical protein
MRKLSLYSTGICLPIQLQTPRIEQPSYASSFALVETVLLKIFYHRTNVECLKLHRAVSPDGIVRLLKSYLRTVGQARAAQRACAENESFKRACSVIAIETLEFQPGFWFGTEKHFDRNLRFISRPDFVKIETSARNNTGLRQEHLPAVQKFADRRQLFDVGATEQIA